MKEILFRGKQTSSGEWLYGIPVTTFVDGCLKRISMVEHIEYETLLDHSIHVEGDWVNPETVGQYTGWKDIYVKRIFEGDILKGVYVKDNGELVNIAGVVKYCLGGYQIRDGKYVVELCHVSSCKIIGNIHDNPELLEVLCEID